MAKVQHGQGMNWLKPMTFQFQSDRSNHWSAGTSALYAVRIWTFKNINIFIFYDQSIFKVTSISCNLYFFIYRELNHKQEYMWMFAIKEIVFFLFCSCFVDTKDHAYL